MRIVTGWAVAAALVLLLAAMPARAEQVGVDPDGLPLLNWLATMVPASTAEAAPTPTPKPERKATAPAASPDAASPDAASPAPASPGAAPATAATPAPRSAGRQKPILASTRATSGRNAAALSPAPIPASEWFDAWNAALAEKRADEPKPAAARVPRSDSSTAGAPKPARSPATGASSANRTPATPPPFGLSWLVAPTSGLFAPNPALDPRLARREVAYETSQPVGTIVVDTEARHLYHVRPDGKAVRYAIGVGRQGFTWKGTATIRHRAEWPAWHPPASMRAREPWLPVRMEGGEDNPLGARALYLFDGDVDTLYRIHGTNQPETIGQSVSSGCIRLMNDDIVHLYENVKNGTRVVVL